MYSYLLAALAGAVVAFLLDPDRGRARRAVTRDRIAGLMRRGGRQAERTFRAAASDAYGISQKVAHPVESARDFDDATLAQKVMSELFRDQRIPKGSISVNVENGVVLLRGEVEDSALISRTVERTRRIGGVVDVESLLHLPGESIPRS
jgi:hypothetical protein